MKRKTKIFFAHSAGAQNGKGKGSFDLVSYLRDTLGEDYEVIFPIVNEPDRPAYHHWKTLLDQEFNKLHEPVILAGHSPGGRCYLNTFLKRRVTCKSKECSWSLHPNGTKMVGIWLNGPFKKISHPFTTNTNILLLSLP